MAKTNSGLVNYVNAQVGKPYWYGTFGQTASASLLAEKKKQYPRYYTASDFKSQFGKRVHDCNGLNKGYLWSATPTSTPVYNSKQDVDVDTLYKYHCKSKGSISSFKKVKGQNVFKGSAAKKTHVGVYVGDNKVVEAKGHAYGVVVSKITDGWTYWGQCEWITDDVTPKPTPTPTPTPTPEPKGIKYKVTAKSGLWVRKGPGKNYGKIKCLSYGTKVTVYQTKNGWGKISKTASQWCCMAYLKKC